MFNAERNNERDPQIGTNVFPAERSRAQGWGCSSVIKCLPGMGLGLIPSIKTKQPKIKPHNISK